ncbi:hypothetical protein LguiB_025147 [Lonicera macranthoides]
MLGAGLQFGRSRGDDRFYNPAKARSARRNSSNLDNFRRALSDVTATQSPSTKDKTVASTAYREPGSPEKLEEELPKPVAEPALEPPVGSSLCNLDRFLESVVPSVPAQYLSKTTMRGLRTCDVEFQPYFVLGDLWESFKEWSAYGVGVPLILNDSDSVVQYYVPYLSGIQLYGDSSKSSVKSGRPGEDSDGDSSRDSCSDGSSDCEHERVDLNYSRGQQNYYHRTSGESLRMDRLSSRHQHTALQEGFSSDEGESGNSLGSLLFEYLERDPPFSREPLADKISDLALRFPGLKTLRSCDLSSSSWISVAWYPIYRIPTGPTLRDLDACFLTFHYLHTTMTGTQSPSGLFVTYPSEIDSVPKILLPVFGLASYKFKVSLWTTNGGSECQLVNSLLQAADNWLMMLQVHHPDFLFFSRR